MNLVINSAFSNKVLAQYTITFLVSSTVASLSDGTLPLIFYLNPYYNKSNYYYNPLSIKAISDFSNIS